MVTWRRRRKLEREERKISMQQRILRMGLKKFVYMYVFMCVEIYVLVHTYRYLYVWVCICGCACRIKFNVRFEVNMTIKSTTIVLYIMQLMALSIKIFSTAMGKNSTPS